jgi:hypothetical protein
VRRRSDARKPAAAPVVHRFTRPVLSGHHQFAELVHSYGGRDLVARDLHMSPDLVDAYTVGKLEPPYAVLLAVYWQSAYGFAQGFSESHWAHQFNTVKRREAEAKVERYRLLLGVVAARALLSPEEFMVLADAHGIDDAWAWQSASAPALIAR